MHPIRTTFTGLLLACCGTWATAQSEPVAKDFQMVQRIDNTLIGVDTISLELLGSRYVAGSYFLINMRKPSPIAGRAEFVVDCHSPMRLATLTSTLPSGSLAPDAPIQPPQRRAGAIDVASLAFTNVHMLDGTWLVADFACQASSQPGRAVALARKSLEQGGPPDMQTLYCDLQADGGKAVRRGVEVRFSDSEDAVAVNHQWLSSGYVTDAAIIFGGVQKWVIDRKAPTARLMGQNGKPLYTGACDRRPPAGG
jgi:hypothetical protein